MRKCLLLITSLVAMTCATITPAAAIQCVQYAREISGINLKGDAWQWWTAATGVYDRGRAPKDGAVLVFTRQGSMRHGHVSVVTRVLSNRLVLVDHANWAPARGAGRGSVTTAVPVLDVSPRNDWTQVRVWFQPTNDFGSRIYRTDGYVYQPRDPRASRPKIHQVALNKAAEMFPNERPATAARAAKPLESSKSEAAAPMVQAIAAEAVAKAAIATAEIAAPAAVQAQPVSGAEGMVKVAKSVYGPSRAATHSGSLDTLLFN